MLTDLKSLDKYCCFLQMFLNRISLNWDEQKLSDDEMSSSFFCDIPKNENEFSSFAVTELLFQHTDSAFFVG